MVNLNNTLFMRSLQARENAMLREQAMEQAAWDRLLAGQESLEAARDRGHMRQMERAKTEGALAAALKQQAPQMPTPLLQEELSRGYRGQQVEERLGREKQLRDLGSRFGMETFKHQGRVALQKMRDAQTEANRKAANMRARKARQLSWKQHEDDVQLALARLNNATKRLGLLAARTKNELTGTEDARMFNVIKTLNERARAQAMMHNRDEVARIQKQADTFLRGYMSGLAPEKKQRFMDLLIGLDPGDPRSTTGVQGSGWGETGGAGVEYELPDWYRTLTGEAGPVMPAGPPGATGQESEDDDWLTGVEAEMQGRAGSR